MSTVLCIDTASSAFALALALNGEVVAHVSHDAALDHSRRLLQAIDDLLGEHRATLDGLAVVTGPGNYAGLRVGIATAEGLALARMAPIAGIPTMEAIVRASGIRSGAVIHPAGRNQFAVQDVEAGVLAGPPRALPATEITGPGIAGEGAATFGGHEVSPGARCIAALELALERLATRPPGALEAIYLHEPHITVPRRQVPASARTTGETP